MPESLYVDALLDELTQQLTWIQNRDIISIFFGGGTPSLFSPAAIARILQGVKQRTALTTNCEITLEANPGTIDQERFHGFRDAGVNRLSIGIQSLQDDKLKILGRIHQQEQATSAITFAKQAGFDNFNVDIMYGLPQQSIDDALHDINTALAFEPTHFSWYQLTIEPNTLFHHQPPVLPTDDLIWEMQVAGQTAIAKHGFKQYEVSAYSQPQRECAHNRNYWEFGDYLGIGAGAHSKITDAQTQQVLRFAQTKHPRDYLDAAKRRNITPQIISAKELCFEFMLNALRLTNGVPVELFVERTGISLDAINDKINQAVTSNLLIANNQIICPSELGRRYLNNLISLFL